MNSFEQIHSRQLTAHEAKLAYDEKSMFVDVRMDAEVAMGAIPSAIHIPLHHFERAHIEIPKDRKVVLYCRSGARSESARRFLIEMGYKDVHNLMGGIIDWSRHGYPVGLLR